MALKRNDSLVRNEYDSNKFSCKLLLAISGIAALVMVMTLIGALGETGKDKKVIVTFFLLCIVFLLIPPFISLFLKIKSGSIKYLIVSFLIIGTAMINYIFTGGNNTGVTTLWVLPVVISSLYYSKRLSLYSIIVTVIVMIISEVITKGLMDQLLIISAKRILESFSIVIVLYFLTEKAHNMLCKSIESDEYGRLLRINGEAISNVEKMSTELRSSSDELLSVSDSLVSVSDEARDITGNVDNEAQLISAGVSQIVTTLMSANSSVAAITADIEEMNKSIINLAESSENTFGEVKNATVNLNEVTIKIENISKNAKDLSDFVKNVVIAVKEMYKSLNEVNKNCLESIRIAEDASVKSNETYETIKKLNDSSKQISKIVHVINDITEKTNMLALNAAIEAAGAGEAGKGFAVVANEVKELAKKTGEATNEIVDQVRNMQSNIENAVSVVSKITKVINGINGITNTIASAVTEQSATMGGISDSVTLSSEKVKIITENIDDISQKSKIISGYMDVSSKNVLDIANAVAELSTRSVGISENSGDTSRSIEELVSSSKTISESVSGISDSISKIAVSTQEIADSASKTNGSARLMSEFSNKLEIMLKK